eukprot:6460596-Amphidinium_carterae.1
MPQMMNQSVFAMAAQGHLKEAYKETVATFSGKLSQGGRCTAKRRRSNKPKITCLEQALDTVFSKHQKCLPLRDQRVVLLPRWMRRAKSSRKQQRPEMKGRGLGRSPPTIGNFATRR